MNILVDWESLLVVAVVSIVATVVFTFLLSAGIRYMSLAAVRADEHESSVAPRAAGIGFLGLAALLVLFGLYLIVPFFH